VPELGLRNVEKKFYRKTVLLLKQTRMWAVWLN